MLAAPATKVRRVTLYLVEQNKYEHELQEAQERKLEELERDANRNRGR